MVLKKGKGVSYESLPKEGVLLGEIKGHSGTSYKTKGGKKKKGVGGILHCSQLWLGLGS